MWMSDDYLRHYGISGQRWGIRRFQNRNGTLTEEGKKRYGRKDVEKDFRESTRKHSEAYNRVMAGNEKIPQMADELGAKYRKAFTKAKLTPESKERIWNNLHKDFGVGSDDDEIFKWQVEDYLHSEVPKLIPDSIKKERAAFEKQQDQYWKSVEEITGELKQKYKDTKIKDVKPVGGYQAIDLIINDLLGSELDTHFNAHLSRHFDDYWVYDTKEYNDMISRLSKEFTMDEYSRRYGG